MTTSEIQAAAQAVATELKFHNPADVVGLVDLTGVTAGDTNRIRELVQEVATKRPYLVASTTGKRQRQQLSGRQAALSEAEKRFGSHYSATTQRNAS